MVFFFTCSPTRGCQSGGVLGDLVQPLAGRIKQGVGSAGFYLASLLMLILFVILYNLLSKPINRIQTEAAKKPEKDSTTVESYRRRGDRVLLIRVPLLVVSLLAQCLVLLVASA